MSTEIKSFVQYGNTMYNYFLRSGVFLSVALRDEVVEVVHYRGQLFRGYEPVLVTIENSVTG